ncbi:cytochrome c oxidase assembly protein [Corynebacterium doosanense]|uniref:cytochrome c oxidase assembly protein n=1 Tax=Corynebacterium doosanense TaxID=1121358 RepID=UPI0009D9E4F1|nr:cytochrome c oxidase assembly protein [Corynebacterium doosanense]
MSTMRVQRASTSENPNTSTARATWPIYALAVVVAGLVGGTIGYSFLGESLAVLGIPDPGFATTFGLPFFRAVAWILSALSVGSFMFSAFYISPRARDGQLGSAPLTVDGHIAARTGAVCALLFALVALLMVPMVLSDVSGTPLVQALNPSAFGTAVDQVATSAVWLLCAVIGAVVGVAGLVFGRWGAQPVLLLGAVGMILPLGMEGHAASGGSHDYGTNAYLWHIVFMAVWIGGLMALLAHGRRLGPEMQTAVRRYSAVALFSLVAIALSGVVSALLRIQPADLLTTRYGLIIAAKIVGTILLAVVGFAHRQITIPQLGRTPGAFLRLAVGEIVLMAVVTGIAVTMGRTPPPPPRNTDLSQMQVQLGYDLHREPTFLNVFTMWRVDILFGVIALLLAVFYLLGVRSVRRQGKPWRTSYTVWWLAGCLSLFVTVSSGIGMNMPATYSMHMVGHMLLSMVVPMILTLGAPLTLVKTVWEPGQPGHATPHDWAEAFTHSGFVRLITTPWVNLIQFVALFYVLYLVIPLYEFAISEHAGHVVMNTVFLVSGYMYFWEMVGPDHIPGRRPASIRLAWLVASMPIHLFMGVYLMQLNVILGEEFYRGLDLPWHPDLLRDQKNGGGIAWAFGSFPLTFAFIWLAVEWRLDERVTEREVDARLDAGEQRRAEETPAAEEHAEDLDEFEAYNRMLQRYHSGESNQQTDYYTDGFREQ